MRKALLFFIFITALPVVASAESVHILFPVTTSQTIDSDNSTSSSGASIRLISNSGFGIGVTNLDVETGSRIKFSSFEISYSTGILTIGGGGFLDGLYSKPNSYRLEKISGNTRFGSLLIRIFDKGALVIGYHQATMEFKTSKPEFWTWATGTINTFMLGIQFPL